MIIGNLQLSCKILKEKCIITRLIDCWCLVKPKRNLYIKLCYIHTLNEYFNFLLKMIVKKIKTETLKGKRNKQRHSHHTHTQHGNNTVLYTVVKIELLIYSPYGINHS